MLMVSNQNTGVLITPQGNRINLSDWALTYNTGIVEEVSYSDIIEYIPGLPSASISCSFVSPDSFPFLYRELITFEGIDGFNSFTAIATSARGELSLDAGMVYYLEAELNGVLTPQFFNDEEVLTTVTPVKVEEVFKAPEPIKKTKFKSPYSRELEFLE